MDTPEIWAWLHVDSRGSWALLHALRAELPCKPCVEHYDAYLRERPPVFGAGWFAWTVAFHNEVNVRIGKPFVPLAKAAYLWGRVPLTVSAR